MQVRERLTEFETAGARFVAVAPQAPHQAAHLRDERGIVEISLLLDPDHRLRERVGLGKLSIGGLLSPRGALNYVRAMGRGRRQGRIRGYNLRPGVILIDRNLDVVKTWMGGTYGDYPPIDQVLDELRIRDR